MTDRMEYEDVRPWADVFARCDYIADFVYVRCATNERVVEDVKGHRTDVYRLKRKLIAAVYGIEIQEV